MQLNQKPRFQRIYKKLHASQKAKVNQAIQEIIKNPDIGTKKHGDLAYLRVHKFLMAKQETLLAYSHDADMITLLALGSHENFYRDLKKAR